MEDLNFAGFRTSTSWLTGFQLVFDQMVVSIVLLTPRHFEIYINLLGFEGFKFAGFRALTARLTGFDRFSDRNDSIIVSLGPIRFFCSYYSCCIYFFIFFLFFCNFLKKIFEKKFVTKFSSNERVRNIAGT